MKSFIFFAGLFTLSASAQQLSDIPSLESRAALYNQTFFGGSSPADYLDRKIEGHVSKVRELRTVLPGILYRGGGAGGTQPLSREALTSLCQHGFSTAVYGYTEKFQSPGPIQCTNKLTGQTNTLQYIALKANTDAGKKTVLDLVYASLNDAARGPTFVHCWNGYHASGELAAIALRQICPGVWNGDNASRYWLRHANGAPMISRVRKFVPYSQFTVPPTYQSILCQQTH